MDFRLLGSILLIVGTSIGAGMLGLPIATAKIGFIGSVFLLIFSWFVMTMGALFLLEVNLWLPKNSHVVSMAKATLGRKGQLITWLTYFLLLYSLLSAYISGGSDLLRHLIANGETFPAWLSSCIFTLIFGWIVAAGIRSVDYVNRVLMLIKFSAYFLLVLLLVPIISPNKLTMGDWHFITAPTAIMVTMVSFGYAVIIPSLRIYLHGDIAKLKKAIFIGSLIPLVCYIAWDAAIMGVVPLAGEKGLIAILSSKGSTGNLVKTIIDTANNPTVAFFVRVFTSVCVLTSFLGVGLSLADFLADGLQREKKGMESVLIHSATFLPPLIIVLFFPNAFIKALKYAGLYCVILMILLPAWMAWNGRYRRGMSRGFRVFGGKPMIGFLILISFFMIAGTFVEW